MKAKCSNNNSNNSNNSIGSSRRGSHFSTSDSMTDEDLALMLNNQDFLTHLRINEDFMNTFNNENTRNRSSKSKKPLFNNKIDYLPHEDIDYSYGNGI